MSKILIPLPRKDFDPSEVAVSWSGLADKNLDVTFATPNAQPAVADFRMVDGTGLGIWKPLLRANPRARECYQRMIASDAFKKPISYSDICEKDFSAILLPGGHAKGMREYLESKILQDTIVQFFHSKKPVGAICHGTLLVARSIDPKTKLSVLHGRKTTSLLKSQELTAWLLTCLWLKDYYRTYKITTEDEVRSFLKNPKTDFVAGPTPITRDSPKNLKSGFVLVDRNYVSARWPGDAHTFIDTFASMF